MAQNKKTGRPTKIPGQKGTAEKIFDAAIDLFAQRGYVNVTIRDIASTVGIKESSIYKHYTSKEQILQKIIQYPLAKIYALAARDDTTEQLIAKLGIDGFIADSGNVFLSWMADANTLKILRIFYIELYHNNEIMESFVNLISAGETFWASVFSMMIKQGFVKPQDPQVLASEFLAFFWKTFTDYFLIQYGRTSCSFVELYTDSFERHVAFFMKTLGESK